MHRELTNGLPAQPAPTAPGPTAHGRHGASGRAVRDGRAAGTSALSCPQEFGRGRRAEPPLHPHLPPPARPSALRAGSPRGALGAPSADRALGDQKGRGTLTIPPDVGGAQGSDRSALGRGGGALTAAKVRADDGVEEEEDEQLHWDPLCTGPRLYEETRLCPPSCCPPRLCLPPALRALLVRAAERVVSRARKRSKTKKNT